MSVHRGAKSRGRGRRRGSPVPSGPYEAFLRWEG